MSASDAAVAFIAQATNTPLSLGDLLPVLGVALIPSKGAHGVPGSAIEILIARFVISLFACLPGSFSLNSTRDRFYCVTGHATDIADCEIPRRLPT